MTRRLHLSGGQQQDYVTYQTKQLLRNFIADCSQTDGLDNAPDIEQLQRPDTTNEPTIEHVREIGSALKYIVRDIAKDDSNYHELADKVPENAILQVISEVASNIISFGQFNWGRVVALFYFAYRLCYRFFSNISLIWDIIDTIVQFMRDHVVSWIIQIGGWEAIVEYVSTNKKHLLAFTGASLLTCFGIFVYHKYLT